MIYFMKIDVYWIRIFIKKGPTVTEVKKKKERMYLRENLLCMIIDSHVDKSGGLA